LPVQFQEKITKRGNSCLAIAEKGGKILDYIYFEVRGPEILSEEDIGVSIH
jgi:hypothetical protein